MKKGILKITIVVIGLFLLALGFRYLAGTTRTLSRIVRGYVEVELKKAFDREVAIGKISTNIVNRITFQNVAVASQSRLSEGVVFVCDKVTINYDPLLILLRKQDFGKSIVRVVLKSPHLFLTNRAGEWNFALPPALKKDFSFSLIPDVVVIDGKVTIEDVKEKDRKVEIRNISGIVATRYRTHWLIREEKFRRPKELSSQIRFVFSGESNQSLNDKIRLKGTYSRDTKELSIKLDTLGLNLANYGNLFFRSPNFRVLTGEGDLHLNLTTTLTNENCDRIARMATSITREEKRLNDFSQMVSFSGELVLVELSCRWLSQTLKDIRGKIFFDNYRIGSETMFLRYQGTEVKLRGGVEKYLSDPILGLTLSSNFALSNLPEIVKIDGLKSLFPLQGLAKVSINMSGRLSDPELKAWFLLPQGKIAGRPVEEFQGQFVYQKRILKVINMQGKISKGNVVLSGNIDIDQPYLDLDFALRNIEIKNLVPEGWKDRADGKGHFSGNIFGNPREIQAKGEIDIEEAKFLGTNLGFVSGFLNYAKGKLGIEARSTDGNYELKSALLLSRDTLKISKLGILAAGRAEIVLTGQIGLFGDKKLDLTVLNSYLETGRLTWLAQRTNRFSGRVNFLGKVGGTVKFPEVSGKAWSSSLKIKEEEIQFESGVHYREKILKLSSFRLNSGYLANLIVKLNGKLPIIGGSIQITDGNLQLIAALFLGKSDWRKETKGVLRGEVGFSNLSLGDSWWEDVEAKGAFSIVQPRVGRVSFDELSLEFKMGEKRLNLERIHFSMENGEVNGSGQMGLKKGADNAINIDTQWRNYPADFSFWKKIKAGSEGEKGPSRRTSRENIVNGNLNFRGKLVWNGEWEIAGVFSGNDFEYAGEPLGAVGVNLALNKEFVHFSSLYCGTDLKGDFVIAISKEKTVSGGMELATTRIPYFLRLMLGPGGEKYSLDEIKGKLYGKILFQGSLGKPQISGYLDIERGILSTTSFLFKSTFNYSKGEINLQSAELKFVPEGAVIAKGRVDFNRPEPLEINVALERIDLRELKSLFCHKDLEAFGRVSGNLQLRGGFSQPHLKVELELKDSGVNGLKANLIKTDFRVEKVPDEKEGRIELVFNSFSAGLGKSLLRLAPESRIRYVSSKKLVDFSLLSEFRNVNFANLSIFGGAELSGTANFLTPSPILEVLLTTRELWVNRQSFESGKVRFSYQDRKLFFLPVPKQNSQLLGEVELERLDSFRVRQLEFLQGKDRVMSANGFIDLSGPIDLTIWGKEGKIGASLLAGFLNLRIPVRGDSGFDIKFNRPSIKREKEGLYSPLQMEGQISIANGSIGNLPFDDFRAIFKGDGSLVSVKELTIKKRGEYTIKCLGIIPYPRETKDGREIDFSLEMSDSKASILRVLSREISDVKGELDGFLRITGTPEKPLMNGYLRINKSTLYCREVLKKIENLTCDISVNNSDILINTIRGSIEKGEMKLKGKITLAGWVADGFDVTFENMADYGIPLKIPFLKIPQSSFFGRLLSEVPCSLELKGKIHVYGTGHSYNLDGAVKLENTHFTYPPRAEDTKGLNLDFLKPAVWNFEVKAGRNTWYETKFAEVQVQGNMKLTGPSKDLTVNGALTAVKGEISYLGATFVVKEAAVECVNDELFLVARAECPIKDDTIVLVVDRGKWGNVKPKFISRSDPEMTQEEALVKATGLDSFRLSPQEGDVLLRKELLKLIDSNLASPLIKSILRSTGLVDVVKVDASFAQKTGERLSSPEANKTGETGSLLEGTEITLGKYLSSSLYLGYKLQFEEGLMNKLELRHEVELLYRLKRGTSLKGKLGEKERYFGVEREIRF